MNRIKLFFWSLFNTKKEKKNLKIRGLTPKGLQMYSFNPKNGEVRCETGIWYIEAHSMRRATRHFKQGIEKQTGRKITVTKQ